LAKIDEPLLLWRRHGKSMTAVSYEKRETTRDITDRIKQARLSELHGRTLTREQIEGLTGRLAAVPTGKLASTLLLRLKTDLMLYRRRPAHLHGFHLVTHVLRKDLRFTRRVLKEVLGRVLRGVRDLARRLFRKSRGCGRIPSRVSAPSVRLQPPQQRAR